MAGKNEIKRRKHARLRRREQERQAHRAAERRYVEALQNVLNALGSADSFRSLPEKERLILFKLRFRSIRIMPAEGTKVPRRVLEYLRIFISKMVRYKTVEVLPGLGKVSLEDFLTAGWTLGSYVMDSIKETVPEAVQSFCCQLLPFAQTIGKPGTKPTIELMMIAHAAGFRVSRVNQTMYYLMPHFHSEGEGLSLRLSTALIVHQVKPEAMDVVIEGKSRPVWRVGWPLAGSGMRWAALSGRDLGVGGALADLPMKVYIQSHALIRLKQRVDPLDNICQHSNIFYACQDKEVVALPDSRALVAYYAFKKKLGYFMAEIAGGIVVFRTFLFITNSGTPEGERLDHELRVGKIEKEFLRIDTLSAFVRTDMTLDARVVDVFKRVGLGHLCDLDPELFGKRSPLAIGYAADFVKYMGLDN